LVDIEDTELVAVPIIVPIATEITGAVAAGPGANDSAPVLSDWSNAFTAQTGEQLVADETLVTSDEADKDAPKNSGAARGLDGGAIALPNNFQATSVITPITLDLNPAQSSSQLAELVELQIQNTKAPDGAKGLTVSLNPEGFGRLRINATSDGSVMRVKLQLENVDAAKMIEQLMPQLEAQIAASVAMPVEFELVQEDLLGDDEWAQQFAEADDDEGEPAPSDQDASSELVNEWTQALEDPVLGRGQTFHVVV
jgi:flagellar hook-length control protein FliK